METKRKVYVLDTSVLIHAPSSIAAFEENIVVIPLSVIFMLENLKFRPGETGAHAKECNRILDAYCGHAEPGKISSEGIITSAGGIIRIAGTPDEDAIAVCKSVNGTLVTLDENQRVRANAAGIKAEGYKHDRLDIADVGYTGRGRMIIAHEQMAKFAASGSISLNMLDIKPQVFAEDGLTELPLIENMFLILMDAENPNQTMLGRFSKNNIVKLRYVGDSTYGVKPRNVGQRFALEALLAPANEAPLVILKGPAGTAKTFLTMAAGLEKTYEKDAEYSRILVSRPNTKFDDDIGYLKGGEQEKIGPLIRPIMDNLENLMPQKNRMVEKDGYRLNNAAEDLFNSQVIVAQAMAYMRGRSICNNYIVIDEAQNASINQILGLITRVGEGSKIVILGDPDQIDHPYLDKLNNGLSFASERMKGSPLCWQLAFLESECTRSKLAAEAIMRLSIE